MLPALRSEDAMAEARSVVGPGRVLRVIGDFGPAVGRLDTGLLGSRHDVELGDILFWRSETHDVCRREGSPCPVRVQVAVWKREKLQ